MMVKLEKLANNFTKVIVGNVSIWFSYETPICLLDSDGTVYFTPKDQMGNDWSRTTKKHIGQLPKVDVSCSWEKFCHYVKLATGGSK